ncbi:hypothetical protein HYFRA_00009903 [Hymenoscyphus fraxineus]|uniref:Uncharacterized protein n=1 Tax=Hymenoscyphus fraxineus TaxID=746836 RepID=A0A9N9L2B1_9HELO|nr:hypothetical protein HYFRA_00009903 [Hymenoscyphus fraxineus]
MELWLLGDRFQIPRLQNESIEALNRQATELTRPHSISFHHVYENTMEESPLRLFLAALSAQGFLKEAKKIPSPENYPHEMLIDMLNWAAKHHKKLVKFSQADLVQYFVAENEPTSSLRSIGGGSPISPVSPDSPSSDSTLTSLASSSSFIDF